MFKEEKIAIGIILLNIIYLAISYTGLPESMPTHFNAAGEADGFGNKQFLWLVPGISIFTFLTMYAAIKSDKYNLPKNISIAQAKQMVLKLSINVQLIMLIITIVSIQVGTGNQSSLLKFIFPLMIILVFAPIVGMYIRK